MKNDDKRRTNPAVKTLAAGCAALTLAAMAPATAGAAVTVLNFTNSCDNACGGSGRVSQSYGDTANLNVSYRSINVATGQTHEPFLKYWGNGYGDLQGVVWGGADRVGFSSEIIFDVAEGYEIRLIGFDFASYNSGELSSAFDIASLDGEVFKSGRYDSTRTGHNYFDVSSGFSRSGIRLAWGPDGYEVGLDNIAFEVRAIDAPTGGVPEPGTWALMILGFGATGSLLRRRGVPAAA